MGNWWKLERQEKNVYAIYILIISVLFLGGCTQEQCLRIDSNAYEVKLYQEFNSVKPVNGCLKLTADTGESTEDLTITYYPDCLVAEFMDNGKKAAIFDMEGNQLSQIYDSISPLQGNESYYVVEKDEEFGLADINGKEVMEPSVDYIGAYSEGVLHFVKNKKYGYQTLDGTIEIPAKFTNYDYEHPYIFRGGTALLQGNGGPQGAINKKGEVIVPSGYDWYTLLENGYVKVHQQAGPEENEGLWGLYDNTGKLIIPPTYFTEIPDKGSGKLYMDSNDGLLQFEFEEFMRSGLVDMNGKVVVPPKYGRIDRFSEGFAVVTQEQQGEVLKYD